MGYRFEICRDRAGLYRVRFVAPHGQTVFTTQAISEHNAAESVALATQLHAADAAMVDMTAAGASRRYARRPGREADGAN